MRRALLALLLPACESDPGHDFVDAEFADLENDPVLPFPEDQAPPPPTLTKVGLCPGPVTFNVTSATPGGVVRLIWSSTAAQGTIPTGPCAGTPVRIQTPAQFSAPYTASGGGLVTVNAVLAPAVCGWFAQSVDISTCSHSIPIVL